jgi:hypothetical protein
MNLAGNSDEFKAHKHLLVELHALEKAHVGWGITGEYRRWCDVSEG